MDSPPARPRRAWYGLAVGILLLGLAVGLGALLLGVRQSRSGDATSVLIGLIAAIACPVGAFLVAATLALVIALRRRADLARPPTPDTD